eukprot:639914-Prorocentrum_minimum.AAC.1
MELLMVACDNPANKIRIWMHELAGLANGEFNETAKPTDKPLITALPGSLPGLCPLGPVHRPIGVLRTCIPSHRGVTDPYTVP